MLQLEVSQDIERCRYHLFAVGLAPALPALTLLTSLVVGGAQLYWDSEYVPAQLDVRPGPLRELSLFGGGELDVLCALPRLGGVTKLRLFG